MQKFLDWWQRGLIVALGLSIALLGIGRVEFFGSGGSVSAWSISRTTFFFWLVWKALVLFHGGLAQAELGRLKPLVLLYVFYFAVTVSLLPDFHAAGDYRYFFFGCAHAVMLVDVFSPAPQRRWLLPVLGVLPIILVVRGLAYDPLILKFDLAHRFADPLDHPNTAGYLFAMSLPLCVAVGLAKSAWWRGLSWPSCASQAFALILTFSRGAWLGAASAMLYLAVALKHWQAAAALVLLASSALLFPSIQHRLATITHPQTDPSLTERWQLATSALRLGIEHPILGVGYGRGRLKESLRPRLQGTALKDRPIWHTHNVYVELFAETGTIGLLTFLWLIGQTLLRLWRSSLRRDGSEQLLGFGLAAAWVAAVVTALGDVPFYHHDTRIFFFTLFALAHLYDSRDAGETAL